MFTSVTRCAELITQPCQLKNKVTSQSQEFEPFITCPLHISFTHEKIFIKFGSNVDLSETVGWTYLNHANSRSRSQLNVTFKPWICVHSPYLYHEGFSFNCGQMFTSASVRWCAESITQPCPPPPNTHTPKDQGHRWRLKLKVRHHLPWNSSCILWAWKYSVCMVNLHKVWTTQSWIQK